MCFYNGEESLDNYYVYVLYYAHVVMRRLMQE